MAIGDVLLNNVGYSLREFERDGQRGLIHQYDVEPFGVPFRTAGRQRPEDIQNIEPFIIPNLTRGFGRDRIDSDSAFKADEYRRFFDATVDTRFAHHVALPILEEGSTETGLEVLRASARLRSNLWALWEDDTSTDIVARRYNGSTTSWDGGGTVRGTSNAQVALDLISSGSQLIALLVSANDHKIRTSADGATWNIPTTEPTQNLFSDAVTVHEDIDGGLLSRIGGEAVAVYWDEGNGSITFFTSTNDGDTWADEAVDIFSGNGPQGVAVLAGIDNEDKLYVGTREGLYEVDTAPGTWTFRLMFPMVSHNNNCRRMKVHDDGALWFAQGVDDDSPATIYRMTVVNGARYIEIVPNDFGSGDSLPEARLGPVRWMESAQGFMYVSMGGGKSGRNASIMCHNGKGWHSMRRHGTENQKIEWIAAAPENDGTPRLHYAIRTGSATSDTVFLGQAFVNPATGVSRKYEASGYLDLPYIDAGLPLDSKAWVRVGVNAEDLSASNSNEYINVDYGIDDGSGGLQARTNTDLGDFLSGTSTILIASGAGVSSRNFGMRANLHRDSSTNTDTPKLKDIQIDVLPHIAKPQGWVFQIDLDETAELENKTSEAIAGELETARDLVTLPTFRYGPMSVTYVRVRPLRWFQDLEHEGDASDTAPDTEARRAGYVEVTVEEVLG